MQKFFRRRQFLAALLGGLGGLLGGRRGAAAARPPAAAPGSGASGPRLPPVTVYTYDWGEAIPLVAGGDSHTVTYCYISRPFSPLPGS
jgi:hypothetical protein